MKIRNYIPALIALLLASGCTDQRDLYDITHPMLCVEGDWMPSLGKNNMAQNATAMVYHSDDGVAAKEYFYDPNSVTVKLTGGLYDVLIFNGLMYNEQDTHLDGIFFRGTDHVATFEGCAHEAAANKRLGRADGEMVVSNDMELLTSACSRETFEGENEYFLKYRNGKNGFPTYYDYIESRVLLTPTPVSYYCVVTVNLVNPASASIANGALRGFAGSVFMASRLPSHQSVSHHMRLNSLSIDPLDATRGTIHSPVFVTFGPPLDLPSRRYEFELSIILRNGEVFNRTFDVTPQVEPIIERLRQNLDQPAPVQVDVEINLGLDVELPKVEAEPGAIGVSDWEDDEIIRVVIKP